MNYYQSNAVAVCADRIAKVTDLVQANSDPYADKLAEMKSDGVAHAKALTMIRGMADISGTGFVTLGTDLAAEFVTSERVLDAIGCTQHKEGDA